MNIDYNIIASSVIGKIKNLVESDNYAANINSVMNSGFKVWHRAPIENLESIFKYGYDREFTSTNGGNMYGAGVYTVYNFKNVLQSQYGGCVIECRVLADPNQFLIFDKRKAQEFLGKDWRFSDQVKRLFNNSDANRIFRAFGSTINDMETDNGYKTSMKALKIINIFKGTDTLYKNKIKGMIFTGYHDGNVCLIFDFSAIVPVRYFIDNGDGKIEWKTGLTEDNLKVISGNVDSEYKYRHMVDDNGQKLFSYVGKKALYGNILVKYAKTGKYNYIDVSTNNIISPISFDMAVNWRKDDSVSDIPFGEVEIDGDIYYVIKNNGKYGLFDEDFVQVCDDLKKINV